jgi:hypothetical protein
MIARLRGFARFWYHFFVGDDWTIAGGVVIALAATCAVSRITSLPSWWIVPAGALGILALSVARTPPPR